MKSRGHNDMEIYDMMESKRNKKQVTASKDKIPGGLAEGKTPSDFDSEALAKGISVEKEHTDDTDIAQEIAMDHLTENEKYYDFLEDMEQKMDSETQVKESMKKKAFDPTIGQPFSPALEDQFLNGLRSELVRRKKVGPDVRPPGASSKGGRRMKLRNAIDALRSREVEQALTGGQLGSFEEDKERDLDSKWDEILRSHPRAEASSRLKIKIAKKKGKKKVYNPYAVCTESVGSTAGTTERSKWNEDDKDRYGRCIKHVDEKESGCYFDMLKEAEKCDKKCKKDKEDEAFFDIEKYDMVDPIRR